MADHLEKHEHNRSAQKNVTENDDLALHVSREHHHETLHHGAHAHKERVESVSYSKGTTFETNFTNDAPQRDPLDHTFHKHGDFNEHSSSKDAVNITDAEKGNYSPEIKTNEEEVNIHKHTIRTFYRRYRVFVHLFIFLLFTGWWIASLILHRNDKNWEIPFLLWLAISLRLLFFHVPISVVTRPMNYVWNNTGVRANSYIPEKWRIPLGALLVIAVIISAAFATPEVEDNTRANRAVSLFGLVVFLFVMWITSRDRKRINWHTVIVGMLVQFLIALFVLRTGVGFNIFNFISQLARELLGYAKDGVAFLTTTEISKLSWFLISVLPAILFFVSIISILYYWGVLQWVVKKSAVFFFWSMRVSGAEAVVAAASPFIGQGESAMLIRPFVTHLTVAELHQIMASGFATISGSVLIAYIGIDVNGSALISSCVMSIPASLALSKMRWPETEETLTAGRIVIPDDDEHRAANTLHAFANGVWLGLKIAGMILATLLCIIGVVSLINGLLGWWGSYININSPPLTLQLILGYICYPIAFLLGVPRNEDLFRVAQLIGTKIIENEFIAYTDLQTQPEYANLSPRSRLIATYSLCSFANIGSLGQQIGVLSQIAPTRTADVARIAFSALLTGALATFTSASIAGMLVTDQKSYYSPQFATPSS